MNILPGTLIKGLYDSEIVRIDDIKTIGTRISLRFTGLRQIDRKLGWFLNWSFLNL